MGKQIGIYLNNDIEREIFNLCENLDLNFYGVENEQIFRDTLESSNTSFVALGFNKPTTSSAWNDEDFIEYKGFDKTDKKFKKGRFWFSQTTWNSNTKLDELKSDRIIKAYDSLIKSFKRTSKFDKDSQLWIYKDFQNQFEVEYKLYQQELEELVRKNTEYAKNVLGARIIEK